jgi:uncharacterized protein (TIGR02996 family)
LEAIRKIAVTTDEENAFRTALVAAPDDRNLLLVFADWLEEHGRREEASDARRRAADEELADVVRRSVRGRATVVTRAQLTGATGYDIRRASVCFDRYPDCRVAVIGDVPPHELSLEPGTDAVVYYQKGRWVGRYRYQCVGPPTGDGARGVSVNPPVGIRGS